MLKVNENASHTGDSIEQIGLNNLDDLATFLNTSANVRHLNSGYFRWPAAESADQCNWNVQTRTYNFIIYWNHRDCILQSMTRQSNMLASWALKDIASNYRQM